MNMSFVSSLNETPYALTFAGQATPWRAALDEIAHDPEIAAIVAGVIEALRAQGFTDVSTVETIKENMHFVLPAELRRKPSQAR